MHIERALIERIGDVGRKLHTGRSRNDQVSTDLRLWVRDAIDQIDERLVDVQRAFVGRCDADADCILPGYTHMQRAQPVLAPHYWLAYCEKFQRDRERLADARRRTNVLSLGAAALAGTSLPIDREDVARRLGFDRVTDNSLDTSSDRDFAVEFAFVLALIAEHLSTWAEEWIIWSTVGVQLPPAAAGLLHRLVDHAAEDQPRRAGTDPRQDRPGGRQFADAPGAHQGSAAGVQPRFAGRQAAVVRFVRHGPRVARTGRSAGCRDANSIARRLPNGWTAATSTPRR